MPLNSYDETIDWLFNQFPSYQSVGASAYKPDLHNIRSLVELFGSPQNDLKFIHIAGTNGKGSTSSMLASILTESGETVGLFTSPHIVDFRERIRVNGEMISETEVVDFSNLIKEAKLNFSPSFFEISFLMCLLYFKKKKCSICVIETGLGGRLDSTNIITPILSVITNISLEHTNFLGNTVEEIAFEKGGIIKEEVPVVIGEKDRITDKIFESIAKQKQASIVFAEEISSDYKHRSPLLGSYQIKNLHTVMVALIQLNKLGFAIDDSAIKKGLKNLQKNTGLMGRMQIVQESPRIILDVSHNLDGIQKTLEYIDRNTKGKLYLIYGSSSDKNYQEIVKLFPKHAYVSLCKFSNMRSLSLDELNELASKMEIKPKIFSSVHEAIEAIQKSAKEDDTILVFGSFFLISDYF